MFLLILNPSFQRQVVPLGQNQMVTWWLLFFFSRAVHSASYGRGSCSHHSPFHSMRLWSHFIWLPLFLPPPAESFQSILPAFIYCITSLTSTSTTTVLTMLAVFSFYRSSAIQELAQSPVSCLSLSGGVNQSVASGLFQEGPALQPNNLRGGWRRKGRWQNGVFTYLRVWLQREEGFSFSKLKQCNVSSFSCNTAVLIHSTNPVTRQSKHAVLKCCCRVSDLPSSISA